MESVTLEKSKAFALRIIKLYKYLKEEKREYVMSEQLLKSGTSIGANCREASRAQSMADFASKLNIALKEADETSYWLELLYESEYINKQQFDSIIADDDELIRMLVSAVKTSNTKK